MLKNKSTPDTRRAGCSSLAGCARLGPAGLDVADEEVCAVEGASSEFEDRLGLADLMLGERHHPHIGGTGIEHPRVVVKLGAGVAPPLADHGVAAVDLLWVATAEDAIPRPIVVVVVTRDAHVGWGIEGTDMDDELPWILAVTGLVDLDDEVGRTAHGDVAVDLAGVAIPQGDGWVARGTGGEQEQDGQVSHVASLAWVGDIIF